MNRTLISDKTNKLIRNKRPSQYLKDMEDKIGDERRIKDILKTHLINEKAFIAMKEDKYEDFLNAREELIKSEMKNRIKV